MPSRTMRLVAAAGVVTLAAVLPAAQAGAVESPGVIRSLDVLSTLACPTSTSCVSTGSDTNGDGKGAVITAATGAVKVWHGSLADFEEPNAVSCPPGAKKCLFVADNAVGTLTIATGALKVTATPAPPPQGGIVALNSVACPKSCYAVGFEGTHTDSNAVLLHLSAAGKILSDTADTGTGSGAIACPTASLCFMTDYVSPTTSLQVVKKGVIGASHAFPADIGVQGLNCFGSSVCYAFGGNTTASPELINELFPVNPKTGSIGTAITIGGDFSATTYSGGTDCISATTCLVAGFTDSGSQRAALATVTSGTAGSPVNYTGEFFDAAACATATECYGVGGTSAGAIVDAVTG
jgi:hypothetical protein